jgi:hypothetical protein
MFFSMLFQSFQVESEISCDVLLLVPEHACIPIGYKYLY